MMETTRQRSCMTQRREIGGSTGRCRALLITLVAVMVGVGALMPIAHAQPDADRRITSQGFGGAVIGSTKAQLESQLGAGWTVQDAGPVLVDLDGYEVLFNGERQFWALHNAGPGDGLDVFITDNPDWQTADGVGPETTIDDAVLEYGAATVSFSFENEAREFVNFANEPAGRIFFRTGTQGSAGVYAGTATETTEWIDGATISSVWVTCIPDADCPVLAITGVDHRALVLVASVLTLVGVVMIRVSRIRIRGTNGFPT